MAACDRWHGPEKYDEDMAHQRQLERCGWEFWRVRGLTFYRDPVKALEPLWKRLSELGISPTCLSVVEVAAPISPAYRSPQVEAVCSPGGLLFVEDIPAANARSIDDLHDVEIRAALVACVADEGPIAREKLFSEAAKSFGYPNVGKKLRSRFNKALNSLDHTGRVRTDWITVWLPESETSAQLRSQDALNGNTPVA